MCLRKNYKSQTIRIRAAFVLACGLLTAPSFADQLLIPGTSVSLDAPDGFIVASSFSGLQNPRDGSSITITEMPVETYSELLPVFTDLDTAISIFGQKGISIERTISYMIGQQKIPALIGSQSTPDVEVGKYMAIFRGDVTVLLAFNVFDPGTLTPPIVEKVIQSVRLSPAATLQEKVDQLPFSFRVTAPFHVSDAMGGSTAIMPSFEGTDSTGLRPLVIIGRSLSAIDSSSNAEFVAQQLLRGTQGFENAEITRIQATAFGGGNGAFLAAVAGERTIVQFLRIPPDGMYIRLIAFGETTELNQVMSAITEIAGSVVIP